MDLYISLLFVLKGSLLFSTTAFAVHVQVKPAGYWVETLQVHFLKSFLSFLFLFLLEIPVFFFIKTLFFLIILFHCCRVIRCFILFWFRCWLSLSKWNWLWLYSFPRFLDMIINYLGLLALERYVFQNL